jgi:hypothetical protein
MWDVQNNNVESSLIANDLGIAVPGKRRWQPRHGPRSRASSRS